jgi:ferredoxin
MTGSTRNPLGACRSPSSSSTGRCSGLATRSARAPSSGPPLNGRIVCRETMPQFSHRFPLNVTGKYYVTDGCADCDLCRRYARNNIRRDDPTGYSYLFKQPMTREEVAGVEEGLSGCSTAAIGTDGDSLDWTRTPIRDWKKSFPNRPDFETRRAPLSRGFMTNRTPEPANF